jgi:molybdate transport system permease protein
LDFSPIWISLRTALIATVFAVILGILVAYYVIRLGKVLRGIVDGILTLPMVLPPTIVGFFLLVFFGIHGPAGKLFLNVFHYKIVFSWVAPIIASTVVAFPLMYRTMRGALESFDTTLIWSGRTLGLKNSFIFWRIILPNCRYGIIAGTVLAFARGLGEFGATIMLAGNIPGRTQTLSVAVYSAMAAGDDALAYKYVLIDLLISFAVLLVVNLMSGGPKKSRRKSLPVPKGEM